MYVHIPIYFYIKCVCILSCDNILLDTYNLQFSLYCKFFSILYSYLRNLAVPSLDLSMTDSCVMVTPS